jgi:hypothetical protein
MPDSTAHTRRRLLITGKKASNRGYGIGSPSQADAQDTNFATKKTTRRMIRNRQPS